MERMGKETFHVTGDSASPDARDRGRRGMTVGHDLTKSAAGKPVLLWRAPNGEEMLLEVDVYQMAGEPGRIHLICPLCAINGTQHALQINQRHKSFDYEPSVPPPPFPGWSTGDVERALHADGLDIKGGGTLSVEPFECTWEQTPDLARAGFGMGRCTWRVAIDKNVVRPA